MWMNGNHICIVQYIWALVEKGREAAHLRAPPLPDIQYIHTWSFPDQERMYFLFLFRLAAPIEWVSYVHK